MQTEWAWLEPLLPEASPGRATAQDRHAGGDQRHPVSAAHRLSLALLAARQLSATLDGLQYLSQVSARWRLGSDLGRAAHGVARADGTRGHPVGCGSRQPVGQISRKGGGEDDQVGYDAG